MTHIPTQWTTEGFMMRYDDNLKESKTYLEAYKKTEEEHKELFGRARYKSYDSFRMTKNQSILKK